MKVKACRLNGAAVVLYSSLDVVVNKCSSFLVSRHQTWFTLNMQQHGQSQNVEDGLDWMVSGPCSCHILPMIKPRRVLKSAPLCMYDTVCASVDCGIDHQVESTVFRDSSLWILAWS